MKRLVMILATLLAACGNGASTGPVDGEELFASTVLHGEPGCITCHSLEPDRRIVGPSMAGIGSRAGDRVPGMSAAEYLRQSIIEPDAHVVDGFDPGRMPNSWGAVLNEEEIDALVVYLENLE